MTQKQDKVPIQTLQENRKKLISGLNRIKGPDFLKQHASILDAYFRASFENSKVGPELGINKNPYAIVALGGYGRQEQCVHSDVDLLFLFGNRVQDQAESLIQEIIYPLWDIGLEVGYAVRSLPECLSLSEKDFDILTPILDARFICGMSVLYSQMMEQIRKNVLKKQGTKIIDWLIETNQNRHQIFGDSTYRLEPNLKEGQGGLRDYHMLLWIARIKFNLKQPRDLQYLGFLSQGEFETLLETLSFIWDARNRLHLASGRKYDQLHFENQIPMAKAMAFKKSNGQKPVELFLSNLHSRMEFIKQQHLMFLYELGYEKGSRRKKKFPKKTTISDLDIQNSMLCFVSPLSVIKNPELMIYIFEESARLKIPLNGEAKRVIKEFGYLVDDAFISKPSVVKAFERILVVPAPTFNVLKEMLNTDFLVRFIPELKGIVNRVQYDAYHIFPVDLHLLRTVQAIKNMVSAQEDRLDPLFGRIYKELRNRKRLLWAALLHDIGKGASSDDHAVNGARMAESILASKGYGARDIDAVSFLVKEHLFLMKTATRRDIQDEETAIFCARRVKNIERLKMLCLLTVADAMATGPKAWTSWTSALIKDLFLKTLHILEKGELATTGVVKKVDKKKGAFLSVFPRSEKMQMMDLFDAMSPRYLIYTPAQDMQAHARLFQRLGENPFVWDVIKDQNTNTRTVIVCAKDRPGLFSKIAGVFTLNSIDIMDAQIFTWKNNVALDIFTVKAPMDPVYEDDHWERARKNLESALSGRLNLAHALKQKKDGHRSVRLRSMEKPHHVHIDNDRSSFFTIIEVFTHDFPGLLYRITDALFRHDLDIRIAKRSTNVDQVVDVFFVRDLEGEKVDGPELEITIKSAIDRVLQRPLQA
jgi:[protein-PII] uridylyltransferase